MKAIVKETGIIVDVFKECGDIWQAKDVYYTESELEFDLNAHITPTHSEKIIEGYIVRENQSGNLALHTKEPHVVHFGEASFSWEEWDSLSGATLIFDESFEEIFKDLKFEDGYKRVSLTIKEF